MSDHYQTEQRALQQMYQQQRIAELQQARERQQQMAAQNQSRFMDLRNQFIAATAAAGTVPILSQSGFTSRGISAPDGRGVSKQSFFGTILDANAGAFTGGSYFNPFFRVGFQTGLTRNQVQSRAQSTLRLSTSQIGNVALDSILPDFIRRGDNAIGLGNVTEDSLLLNDVFSGIKGRGADQVFGSGITRLQAGDAYEGAVKRINKSSGNLLNSQEIGKYLTTAANSLTSREINGTGGDPGKISKLLAKQVKHLEVIARNSRVSLDSLNELGMTNKSMGNSIGDLVRASSVVSSSTASVGGVNRSRQIQTALGLTAQGRQMNVRSPAEFASGQMEQIYDLVNQYNSNNISHNQLFRYGGANAFEAAERVQQKRIQVGQTFAQQQSGTLGVLGAEAEVSLQGGRSSFLSDLSAEYADNPFAGVVASVNQETQEGLIANSSKLAVGLARTRIEGIAGADKETRRALLVTEISKITGRSLLDSSQELSFVEEDESFVSNKVDEVSDKLGILDRGSIKEELSRRIIPRLEALGRSKYEELDEDLVQGVGEANARGEEFNIGAYVRDSTGDDVVKKDLVVDYLNTLDKSEVRALRESFEVRTSDGTGKLSKKSLDKDLDFKVVPDFFRKQNLSETIRGLDLNDDSLAETIFEQAAADGNQEFTGVDQIKLMLSKEEEGDSVFKELSDTSINVVREHINRTITSRQMTINMEAAERGSLLNPTYTIVVSGNR